MIQEHHSKLREKLAKGVAYQQQTAPVSAGLEFELFNFPAWY